MGWKKGESGNPGGKWKPGQSGNPNGRPKTRPFKDALDRVLRAVGQGDEQKGLDQLASAMFAKAMNGDVAAYKEIADRYEGKVPTPIGGTDELPSIKGFSWIDPHTETDAVTDNALAEGDGEATVLGGDGAKTVN